MITLTLIISLAASTLIMIAQERQTNNFDY